MDENPADGGIGKFADADERIFALLGIVEDQQTAVRAGIQGLAQERAAMATERVALVEQAERMKSLTDKLTTAISQAIPQMAESAGEASQKAFRRMLAAMAQEMAANVAKSAEPELAKFKTAVAEAGAVQSQLGAAVKDFRRKWAWAVAFAIAGLVLAAALVAYGTVWWQLRELGQLEAQRDKLRTEVNALQEQAEQTKRARRLLK